MQPDGYHYAVNVLSRKQRNSSLEDWKDVKRIFRHLRSTTSLGLVYAAKSNNLKATSDESFRDWNDSASTRGYIITLFGDPMLGGVTNRIRLQHIHAKLNI